MEEWRTGGEGRGWEGRRGASCVAVCLGVGWLAVGCWEVDCCVLLFGVAVKRGSLNGAANARYGKVDSMIV